MAETSPARLGTRLGRFGLAAVWLLAALPPALWLVHRSDPELAVRLSITGTRWAMRALLGLGALGAVLLLLFPPFPAWLRLLTHRLKLAMTSNHAAVMKARSELAHFESAARRLELGRLLLLADDLRGALPQLQRAVELDPQVATAHHQLGLCLFRSGHPAQALPHFVTAEKLDRGHAFGDALLHAGRVAFVLGDRTAAAELLRQHERAHGGNRKSHRWLGDALAATGDQQGARKAWQVAAAKPTQRLTADENWQRALARVRLWRRGGRA